MQNLKMVNVLDKDMCEVCRFHSKITVLNGNQVVLLTQCKRKDCDNWITEAPEKE